MFHPATSVSLPPNTTVRLTVETLPDPPASFLRTAQSLNLDGPPDWALNPEEHLDGEDSEGNR